ncbi:doublecortin domain-containing protein 1-like [Polyodon spathula]|uniref:doublecortin domain-containing protein 1-like n=1 Tax=Polyodon spathula TaxID=7913 RepID=UPI001B7E5F72|nr:doublecortin domain-containing protein 1-like [Polyodon spathula]
MASRRGSASASSVGSRSSSTSYNGSMHSRQSSLEDLLVHQYYDKLSKTSQSPEYQLPRKFTSPYGNATLKETKRKRHSAASASKGPRPQSAVVSRRSQSRDETNSVRSNDGASESDSSTSNSISNSSLVLPATSKRPLSAPLRHSLTSSCKTPIFKRQPWVIRVMAYKNGSRSVFAKVAAPNIKLLLEECTLRLNLNTAARRVFLASGEEADEPKDIPHDAEVYISTGEPFVDPFKKIKDHLSLSKEANWTVNGVALPADAKRGTTKPSLSLRMRKLSDKTTVRILVFKNGAGQDGCEVIAAVDQTEKFLDHCTTRLKLTSPAMTIYNWDGKRTEHLSHVPLLDSCLQNSITPLRGPAWVSKGEGFSPSGAKLYIQGVLGALHQKLKPAKEYSKQLDYALDNNNEKVTKKGILSMTVEELYNNKEEVDQLIDELQAAIKKHKGQLSKLALQLQAEEEQCAGYMYRHLKQLSASSSDPQGLQLKVYENGQDTGDTVVYINRKLWEKGCGKDVNLMMDRLLQMVDQRLQSSQKYKPSGLNLIPTCLFDEQGQEICNPRSLQNEQRVWVSYGEDYRSPYNPVLSLTFDRVTAVVEEDNRVVYKSLLDPDSELPTGLEKWEAFIGFPENYNYGQQGSHHQQEKVDWDSHFIQLKEDLQMVLYVSVTMENRSRKAFRKKDNENRMNAAAATTWPLADIWMITKAGVILSRALPQLCLAVGGQPITLENADGPTLEGYKLSIQKRVRGNTYQQWSFGKDGQIFSKAHPEFVLTYLEELNVREKVTQTEKHLGAWSTEHQETARSSANEDSGFNVSDTNQKEVPRPIDTQSVLPGALRESIQLTVALVRKLEDKHPKASAQRWAMKHEGTARLGQWKHSQVGNPLWNKLTYMWPVLPDGELNEDFNWPLEGSLIPNAPPLKKPASKKPDGYTPVRLQVLRNGHKDHFKAVTVTGPDITNMLKKKRKPAAKQKQKENVQKAIASEEDSVIKIHRIEFQQFLERCTVLLNLPFAARRLFDKEGNEITLLKDVVRDQLVFVSCGEQWIDPQLTMAERRKRMILNNLESDISQIRNYCAMRSNGGLVLEIVGEVAEGSRLIVNECVVTSNEEHNEDSTQSGGQPEKKENKVNDDIVSEVFENSHTKAHRKIDESYTSFKYPWQNESRYLDENENDLHSATGEEYTNMELYNKYRPQSKPVKIHQIHRQQFEFSGGHIINCKFPRLVLGVLAEAVQSGTEIQLMEKKPDDVNQRWIFREEDRTFHLMSNPGLVLAVSMPKIRPGDTDSAVQVHGCSVVLQTYKSYSYGVANQKWDWIPEVKVLSAFYTTEMDQEITAANQASLCTFSVSGTEEIDQQGFSFTQSSKNRKMAVCSACARALRGKSILTKLPPGASFYCATGCKESQLNPSGPFKSLSVIKTDLSTSEAENTLKYFEEVLTSLRKETSVQAISQEISAARTQRPVKIKAYRNGAGFKDGQLITATTMPMLLSMCTSRLELSRAACRLYTVDGTPMQTVSDLIAWTVNECLQESSMEEHRDTEDTEELDDVSAESLELSAPDKAASRSQLLLRVTAEELGSLDETLLTLILRNPVDVWVSSGEPFLPLHVLIITKGEAAENAGCSYGHYLVLKRHKMRLLQGRRVGALKPARMIPTKSSIQPVVVEGGWTEPSQEEVKLMEDVQNMEVHLSEVQIIQTRKRSPFLKTIAANQRDLYSQPDVKRVQVYMNGTDLKQGVFAWGKNMEELLGSCTSRLNMRQPAQVLYAMDGVQLSKWDEIERDMLICVSSGEPFMSTKANRHNIEIRANYARVRKDKGPAATDIVVTPKGNPKVKVEAPSNVLALPAAPENIF